MAAHPDKDPPSSDPPPVHVYDDIAEMDNPLPRWWLLTFAGTIVFAIGYFYYYEGFRAGPTPTDELAAARADDARRRGVEAPPAGPEQLMTMSRDAALVAEGATTFAQLCAPCHGASAEGKIGPNLTDAYWLHGGRPEQILTTIASGYPDKGMPAWKSSLGAHKTELVTAYVLSLRGQNRPGKAPQGTEEKD